MVKRSKETWTARLLAREEKTRVELQGAIESWIIGEEAALPDFRISVHPNATAREVDVSVYQSQTSREAKGRVAVRADLERVLRSVGARLPPHMLKEYRLVESKPMEDVHDAGAPVGTLFGKVWHFGAPPKRGPSPAR